MPHHNEKAPGSSQPAATMKPHTRGDLRLSIHPVHKHLAWAVTAHIQAADTIGLGTPIPLGMIQQWHTHCHSSFYLKEQAMKPQPQVVLHIVRGHPRLWVVQAELIRWVQAAVINMITYFVDETLIQCIRCMGCSQVKVDDRVTKVRCSGCLCREVNWLGWLNNMARAAKEGQHLSPPQHRCHNEL